MGRITGICVDEETNQVCIVDWTRGCLCLLNKNYAIVKEKHLKTTLDNKWRSYTSICYNKITKAFYLIDNTKLSESILMFDNCIENALKEVQIVNSFNLESIKCLNNKIYVCDNHFNNVNSRIIVYDAVQLNYIKSVGMNMLSSPIDILTYNNKFYYVTDSQNSCIQAFNVNNDDYENDEYIDTVYINTYPNHTAISNNKLIIIHRTTCTVYQIAIYEIIKKFNK